MRGVNATISSLTVHQYMALDAHKRGLDPLYIDPWLSINFQFPPKRSRIGTFKNFCENSMNGSLYKTARRDCFSTRGEVVKIRKKVEQIIPSDWKSCL